MHGAHDVFFVDIWFYLLITLHSSVWGGGMFLRHLLGLVGRHSGRTGGCEKHVGGAFVVKISRLKVLYFLY